jgi:hypothetical protein
MSRKEFQLLSLFSVGYIYEVLCDSNFAPMLKTSFWQRSVVDEFAQSSKFERLGLA